MNRRDGAKKQTRLKKAPSQKAGELTADSSEYVLKVAAAMSEVSSAQDKWVQEIEAVSQDPALLQDPACQARLNTAMTSVVSAADYLRIEPVPDTMQAAHEMLGRARAKADLAATGTRDESGALSIAAILAAIQHLDDMGQLLQDAYQLIRSYPAAR